MLMRPLCPSHVSYYPGMPNPIYTPLPQLGSRTVAPSAPGTHADAAIDALQSIQAKRKTEEVRAIVLNLLGYE